MGIVIDGKVHYGKDFSAGEFRSALKEKASGGQFSLDTEEAFQVEMKPEVMEKFIRELAKNIALLVNVFNLSQVFLGGGDIERHRDLVRSILKQEIQQNWPYPNEVRCEIHFSSLGDKSVAYGAAGMVFDRLFSNPQQIFGLEEN